LLSEGLPKGRFAPSICRYNPSGPEGSPGSQHSHGPMEGRPSATKLSSAASSSSEDGGQNESRISTPSSEEEEESRHCIPPHDVGYPIVFTPVGCGLLCDSSLARCFVVITPICLWHEKRPLPPPTPSLPTPSMWFYCRWVQSYFSHADVIILLLLLLPPPPLHLPSQEGSSKSVLRFQPVSENRIIANEHIPKGPLRLAFKVLKTESKLIRATCSQHGMMEVHPNSSDFNIMWAGHGLKPQDVSRRTRSQAG